MSFHSSFVASKAGLVLRLVDWFAVDKSAEPPTARGRLQPRYLLPQQLRVPSICFAQSTRTRSCFPQHRPLRWPRYAGRSSHSSKLQWWKTNWHTYVLSEDYDATGRIMRVRGLPDAITRLRRTLAVP